MERLFLERLLFLLWFAGQMRRERDEGERVVQDTDDDDGDCDDGEDCNKSQAQKMSPALLVVAFVAGAAWAMLNNKQQTTTEAAVSRFVDEIKSAFCAFNF